MKRVLAAIAALVLSITAAAPAHASTAVRDGRLAFWDFDTAQVYTVRTNGTDLRQLTHVPDGMLAGDPDWSFDGRRIAYDTFARDGSTEDRIWTMNADGTGQRQVLDDPGYADDAPRFTPDGAHLVFARCSRDIEACAIASVATDGTDLRMLTPLTEETFDSFPDVSATGRVVFTRFNANGITAQIFVLDAHGVAVAVTPDGFGARLPKWAPDGAHIVMESCCVLNRDIYSIEASGRHLTRLTYTAYPKSRRWPSYAPSGTRIAYVGEKPVPEPFVTSDLFVMDANGRHQVRVHTGLLNPVAPVWQPIGG